MIALKNFVSSLAARMSAADGQTMAEYGMLLAVIAIIVVAAALFLGQSISSLFVGVGSSL
jgi:Flp pilus assembly pilin Flp